jgi:tetratricopeptide (TPR) repeat protein
MQGYMNHILISIFFILMQYSYASELVSRTKIDTTWWYAQYQKGINLIDQNNLESAETEFRIIIESDDEIAYAYFGLGLVYDKIERASDKAEEYFLEAIDIDPEMIEAHYYLGFLYEDKTSEDITHGMESRKHFKKVTQIDPHFIDGWIELARVSEKFHWPPYSKPAEILAEGLKLNPENALLYSTFKHSTFWHREEEAGIPVFEFMIDKFPKEAMYAIDLAKALYNLDQFAVSIALLDSIERTYSEYSNSQVNLLRAKIGFNSDDIKPGTQCYLKALDTIEDSLDAKEIFADIRYLMTNLQYDEYQMTSIADMSAFFKRFWLARDPNLATPQNERIPLHLKRLNYAQKNYRRYLTSQDENALLYKFVHPLNGVIPIREGDVLIRSLITEALKTDLDIDDMGLIYIRHGEPDNLANFTCMTCPQNISWQYFARQNQPEMIFHFRKHGDARGWFLESIPYAFSNRGDFGGVYALLDPTFEQTVDIPDRQYRYEKLNEENIGLAKVGLNTESDDYKYKKSLINFPLKLISFKSTNSETEVGLYFWIGGSVLRLDTSEPTNMLKYKKFIGIFDDHWNEMVRYNKGKQFPILLSPELWENSGFVEMEKFSVPPGKYYCEIQLEDNVSDHIGVYKGSIVIPNYYTEGLMLSDVILSGTVMRSDEYAPYKKGDVAYDPHMFSAFKRNETVGVYVEVYNLLLDTTDRTDFAVTWFLREADSEDELVQSTLAYSGSSTDDKIFFNLELATVDTGDYEMVIQVKDRISEAEVRKIIKLSVR